MTQRLLSAVAFLTRFAVGTQEGLGAAVVGRASVFFPLVGAGLGVSSVLFLKLLSLRFEAGGVSLGAPWLPAPLMAIALVGLSAWMTGGIHLDGLADTADGLGGGWTPERALEIMRDPRIGAFGAVALILVLFAKVAATSFLIERGRAVGYLIAAPTLARWASVALGRYLPYARAEDGLGAALTEHVGRWELAGATILAAIVVGLASGSCGIGCWLAVVLVTWWVGRLCRRRLGGVTGDTLGANIELSEVAVLVVGVGLTG